MRVLFHLPWTHDYLSEMDEEREAVLAVVWDRWRPRVKWIHY